MEIDFEHIKLREFTINDKFQLAKLCNNKKIWDNLRDFIPFPYTETNALEFIKFCNSEKPTRTFAIEHNGKFSGTIGLVLQTDIYRLSAELGYWIGEEFWNKGIATAAVKSIVKYGFTELGLIRIYSGVFDFNKASQKVLVKAGFKLEGVLEKAVIKNGIICNEYRYAITI